MKYKQFKGTPGSWSYHITEDKIRKSHNIRQGDIGGKTIALMHDTYTTEEENQANAILIASAPELLDALIQVIECWDSIEPNYSKRMYDIIHQVAKPVINKALNAPESE